MNKKLVISVTINLIIFVLTVIAAIIMFTGYKFMEAVPLLESTEIGMLRFFTVDSNFFMGIVALIFAIQEIKIIYGKKQEISTKMYILKLMATVAVGLTFATVFGYLGFIVKDGVVALLKNSSLFFHLIIPVLSFITFAVFERTDKIKFRYNLYSLLPTLAYATFYLTNALTHLENGKIPVEYDWYWFAQGGLWQIPIVVPLMMGVTYLISLILWRINKKGKKSNETSNSES